MESLQMSKGYDRLMEERSNERKSIKQLYPEFFKNTDNKIFKDCADIRLADRDGNNVAGLNCENVHDFDRNNSIQSDKEALETSVLNVSNGGVGGDSFSSSSAQPTNSPSGSGFYSCDSEVSPNNSHSSSIVSGYSPYNDSRAGGSAGTSPASNCEISPNIGQRSKSYASMEGLVGALPFYPSLAQAALAVFYAGRGVKSAGDTGGGDAPYLGGGMKTAGDTGGGDAPYLGEMNDAGSNATYVGDANLSKNVVCNDIDVSPLANYFSMLNTGSPASTNAYSPAPASPQAAFSQQTEIIGKYSRKVFVGGLPPDIDEDEIIASFSRFGPLIVDWPHKSESKSFLPPKGYAFLLFHYEYSVHELIDFCTLEDDKLYCLISSPTFKDKPVQIRPWHLIDAEYVKEPTKPLDKRLTVFVGGVPRPLKAFELAAFMDRFFYGNVCQASIDVDPLLKYPKGAASVTFSNQESYVTAVSTRFVQLHHGDIDKRVELKPYLLDDQMCDVCKGQRCEGKFAPYFCANVSCLQYFCDQCWSLAHSRQGREFHRPLVKEGTSRPRTVPMRWY